MSASVSQYGGAIATTYYGTINKIEYTYFTDNYIIWTASSSNCGVGGAAIANCVGSTISTIDTCYFDGNYINSNAYAWGGAICNYYYSTIDTISNSIFSNNYVYTNASYASYGGAICNYASTIDTISNSTFSNNYAYSSSTYARGGAIYNYGGYIYTITNCIFSDNYTSSATSASRGGAICNYTAYIGEISYSTFSDNSAISTSGSAYGGAIYNSDIISEISYSDFSNNSAISIEGSAYGGAIYNSSTINITDSSFNNNSATSTDVYGLGGAIYNSTNGVLTYTITEESTIINTGNTATAGGFLFNYGNFTFDVDGTLIIGEYGKDDNVDSVYNDGTLVKNGTGTILIRSSFENFGSFSLNEGTLIVEGSDETEDLNDAWFNSEIIQSIASNYSATLMLGSYLYVGNYISVGSFDENYEFSSNSANFASDSLLVIHGDSTGGSSSYSSSSVTAALIGDGYSILNVESGAGLVVYITSGDDLRIAEDFDGASSKYSKWDLEAVVSANPLYSVATIEWREEESDSTEEEITVMSYSNEIESYDDTVLDDTVITSTDAGTSVYLTFEQNESGVTDTMSMMDSVAPIMGILTHLARDTTMARFSAVNSGYSVGKSAFNQNDYCKCSYDAESNQFYCNGNCPCCGTKEEATNWGVWAIPMYTYSEARGLNAGAYSTGYDMYFAGGNVGADYTFGDNYRIGLALHGGAGESNSVGDFNDTNNDFSFYSFTLYNGYKSGNWLFYADLNFAITDNDIEKYNSAGSNLYADIDAFAFSADLRVDYNIQVDKYTITPHAGFEYIYISLSDYDVKQSGNSILNVDTKGQSIFSIPVGITFTREFILDNDWFLSPIVDL
ncbi:MAG: autotransporter domain-containing protein [Opitutales bacterium]